MAAARALILPGVFCVSVFCIFSWKYSVIGVQAALQLAGRGLLFLALAVWMVSSLYPKLKSFLFPASPAELENPVDEASSRVKQEQARREQQEHHVVKSSAYHEAVLKPRQEAVRRKKEEDFYRMTGQTWKLSQGSTLGGEEETEANTEEDDNKTPNQKAARRRKQLETPHQAPVQKELPKEKKIIILPDEPPENTEGVLRIALRCPSGRTLQRRFFKACSSSHASVCLGSFRLAAQVWILSCNICPVHLLPPNAPSHTFRPHYGGCWDRYKHCPQCGGKRPFHNLIIF
ncbi:UBX domain-containing protein 8 isoform X1 [Pygocentrus nattereri]|uniref:UBX domain-containing protein 8 isoform X1 n=1 Tax=Pygocentrus nattereri TaxID=42514 RepID=UPI0008147BF2|nr:UBX domain-containing protein 8 isoform X1 [Pygocentrus nattereri]